MDELIVFIKQICAGHNPKYNLETKVELLLRLKNRPMRVSEMMDEFIGMGLKGTPGRLTQQIETTLFRLRKKGVVISVVVKGRSVAYMLTNNEIKATEMTLPKGQHEVLSKSEKIHSDYTEERYPPQTVPLQKDGRIKQVGPVLPERYMTTNYDQTFTWPEVMAFVMNNGEPKTISEIAEAIYLLEPDKDLFIIKTLIRRLLRVYTEKGLFAKVRIKTSPAWQLNVR